MHIVLVVVDNFQEYILSNIENLLKFSNNDITIITNNKFINRLETFKTCINVVAVESLMNSYENDTRNDSNNFWFFTTYRFNVIYHYMKIYNKEHICHIENDVLVYRNLDNIQFHSDNKILLTMDSNTRCIPGIMVIPNNTILKYCLDNFEKGLNDMENWGLCYKKFNNLIDTLPIFINDKSSLEKEFITNNFNNYNCIFDAAAIGQYLGGVDPRNIPGNTVGFVNETCVFDYSKYTFIWKKNVLGLNVPYIQINNIDIPIINLHIHCKHLNRFINNDHDLFDWQYYLDNNPDLRPNGVLTQTQAKEHWIRHGQSEGRIYYKH